MSLQVCADCGTAYAPAAVCPHCGGGVYRFGWEEEDMPKATVEGGGSDYSEGGPVEEPLAELKPKAAAKPKTPVSKPRVADAGEDED